MSDDRFMADLLGAAPSAPDPAFRFEVFARIAVRSRRRQALRHAALQAAVWAGIGLIALLAQAGALAPLLAPAGVLLLAGAAALLAIEGPSGVLARSRALLKLAR